VCIRIRSLLRGVSDNTKPKEIAAFLERKGAVLIFAALGEGEKRFTDLDDELDISHTTLGNLLSDGVDIDVFELAFSGSGGDRMYRLTPLGKGVQIEVNRRGVIKAYSLMREAEERYQNEVDDLINWVLSVEDFKKAYDFARAFDRFQDVPLIYDSEINEEILAAIDEEDDGYKWE